MIKFFRKIRRNLLSEGKTGKYFKYAIGEIILVVIGILIALSINNWNSQRQAILKLESNFKYLKEDLNSNKRQLLNLIERREKVIESCTKLLDNYLERKNITSREFISTYYLVVSERKFESVNNGISKIMSSNSIESKEFQPIRDLLRSYKNDISKLKELEEKENAFIENMEAKLTSNGFIGDMWINIREIKNGYDTTGINPDFDFIRTMEYDELKFVIVRYEVVMPWVIEDYNNIIDKGEMIIDEIKNHYDSK